MHTIALSLALTAATVAQAQDPLEHKPCTITPLKLHWFDVDGTPYRWNQIEGWMLTDPSSRGHALKAARMKAAGAALTSLGATALVVGAGFGLRSVDDDGGSTFLDWIPVAGGAVLIAAGIPLLHFSNKEEKRAVEVWGNLVPQQGGATVSVGGSF
jgi:hypothetical protein